MTADEVTLIETRGGRALFAVPLPNGRLAAIVAGPDQAAAVAAAVVAMERGTSRAVMLGRLVTPHELVDERLAPRPDLAATVERIMGPL